LSRVEHKTHIARQDIEVWDGVERDFTRETSTGAEITVQKYGNEVDVLLAYGSGTDFTDAAISSAEDAITADSSNAWMVLTPGTWTISSDLTLTQGLRVPYGAILSIDSGKTLTINGPLDAGFYQIFSGSGTANVNQQRVNVVWYSTSGNGTSASKWVGGLTNAFSANAPDETNNYTYYCPSGHYEDTSTIELDGVGYYTIEGDGPYSTKFYYNQTDDTSLLKLKRNGATLTNVEVKKIGFYGSSTATGAAIEFEDASWLIFEDLWFKDWDADTVTNYAFWSKGKEYVTWKRIRTSSVRIITIGMIAISVLPMQIMAMEFMPMVM
jgi:hypothetical protein